MGSLENLVQQIVALSGEADLGGLHTALKSSAQDNVMRQNAAALLTAVAGLDPTQHSLGTLFLLEAKARASGTQQGDRDLLEAACRFLPACTERQVRMAPDKCESAQCMSIVADFGAAMALHMCAARQRAWCHRSLRHATFLLLSS
jgi:hypothetical protein